MIKNAHRGTSHNLLCRKSALLRTELATNFEGVGDLFARPAPSCARAGGGLGRIGKTGWIFRAGCRRRTRLLPRSLDDGVARRPRPRVGRRRVRRRPVRRVRLVRCAVAGHAGVVRQRLLAGSSRGSPSGDEAASDIVDPKPKPRESISAWAWRVGEPVLFDRAPRSRRSRWSPWCA